MSRRGAIVAVGAVVIAAGGGLAAWLQDSSGGTTTPATTATTTAPAPPVTLRIIFPEGFTRREMVARVVAVRAIAIRKRHVTPRLTASSYHAVTARVLPPIGFRKLARGRIEGFLFPATYDFTAQTTAKQLVAEQLAAFKQRFGTVNLRYARSKNLTSYDVLIIASMIEKEAVVPSERRLIAAVIYNRLHHRMPLGIDATIRYGLNIPGTKSLTKAALASSSPYNTRRFPGLPPTPIANPGLASIRAAAHPTHVDYLYFVRKPDKKHHFFTADENEFLRKVCQYGFGCK
ncbi:MAG: endolytic transglycosylase MltG [Actinobacteria bacterium]|nr:MAG: endolytic transglycosylase MltG [Actinomycetota bacterium]